MDISKVSKLDFFNFNINTAGSGQFEIVLKLFRHVCLYS